MCDPKTIKCSECKKVLYIVGFMGVDDDDMDGIYVRPCRCQEPSKSNRLSFLEEQYNILKKFFYQFNITSNNIDNDLKDILTDVFELRKEDSKKLNTIDILEPIIDKIIPEYKDVPFEYKVLLLNERMNKQYIETPEFGFNKEQIDQLVNILIKSNSKINFIKALREIKKIGLKEAKYLAEQKIRHFEFESELLVNDAKRIIMERF
jgi:ribosomal protein L7/L12